MWFEIELLVDDVGQMKNMMETIQLDFFLKI
jgi:hypothetical protein